MTAPLARPTTEALPAIPELAVARVLAPMIVREGAIPAGTQGVIVHASRGGAAYELEIYEPFHAVVTVAAANIARA